MRKAFTLIELVVAVALLAIVFLFAGTIFKVSINAYRTAVANTEIIQKLRAITDQLNADFKGIRTDAPLLFWFNENNLTDPNRYDQIMFFADGDFQSTQVYAGSPAVPASAGDPVVGNVARIFYGQAQSLDSRGGGIKIPADLLDKDRLLARRRHILTADTDLDNWPLVNMSNFDSGSGTDDRDKYNEWYEHDRLSLAQWKTIQGSDYDTKIIPTCFEICPLVDKGDPNTFHKLMCEGVGSFAIQWAYWDSSNKLSWYPTDTDFVTPFGVYFNVPGLISGWVDGLAGGNDYNIYPAAIKFTFTLYDSKAVFKEGRTFTHIVYIGD